MRQTYFVLLISICVGHPGDTTIVEPIGRSLKNRQMMAVYPGPPGKLAITHIKTIAFDGKLSACLVRIETGRTHQIRVHMKHRSVHWLIYPFKRFEFSRYSCFFRRTPIAGDSTYGNSGWNSKLLKQYGVNRPLLHAYSTTFKHPYSGQAITLQAPIPEDIKTVLSKLNPVASDLKNADLFDQKTGYLTCSLEVKETYGGGGSGLDGVVSANGFVPFDRLVYEDDHFTTFDLPETMDDD